MKKIALHKAQLFMKAQRLQSEAHELLLEAKGIKSVSIDLDSGIVTVDYHEFIPLSKSEEKVFTSRGDQPPAHVVSKHKYTFTLSQFFKEE